MDGTQLLVYIYTHVYILPYFHQNKMIKFLGSLLQCIGQNVCTNFIEIVIFFYFFVCVSIIVFQLFTLCYFNDSFRTFMILFLPLSVMKCY